MHVIVRTRVSRVQNSDHASMNVFSLAVFDGALGRPVSVTASTAIVLSSIYTVAVAFSVYCCETPMIVHNTSWRYIYSRDSSHNTVVAYLEHFFQSSRPTKLLTFAAH